MSTNSDPDTTSGGYYAEPADAAATVWFVFGPTGSRVGSCATREGALRLISLVGGNTLKPKPGTEPEPGTRADEVEEAALGAKAPVRPQMFEWYAPRRGRSALSLVREFFNRISARKG